MPRQRNGMPEFRVFYAIEHIYVTIVSSLYGFYVVICAVMEEDYELFINSRGGGYDVESG